MGFLRHGISRDASLFVLKRRTGPPSTSLHKKFVQTYAAKHLPAPVSSHHGASWKRRYMLVLRFSSQHSRGLFIRVLNNVNATMGRDALKFLLQEVLHSEYILFTQSVRGAYVGVLLFYWASHDLTPHIDQTRRILKLRTWIAHCPGGCESDCCLLDPVRCTFMAETTKVCAMS